MYPLEFVGYVAGALTTLSFLPQAIKCFKTKSTGDISAGMYVIFTTGVALWLTYGFLREDLPIMAANAVTLILAASVLLAKIRYG